MKKQQMRKLLERVEKLNLRLERELADSVLQVSISADKQVVEELRGDENMCQALLEIMEPEINKIKETVKEEVTRKVTREVTKEVTREVTEEVTREVTKAVTREVTKAVTMEAIKNTILALKDCGQTDTIIKQAIIKAYKISPEEADGYLLN